MPAYELQSKGLNWDLEQIKLKMSMEVVGIQGMFQKRQVIRSQTLYPIELRVHFTQALLPRGAFLRSRLQDGDTLTQTLLKERGFSGTRFDGAHLGFCFLAFRNRNRNRHERYSIMRSWRLRGSSVIAMLNGRQPRFVRLGSTTSVLRPSHRPRI